MPFMLAIILGMETDVRMLDEDQCYVEFADYESPNTAEKRDPSRIGKTTVAKIKAEHRRYHYEGNIISSLTAYKPQNLLIESNCITPTIVGNAYGQYLSYVPLSSIEDAAFTEFSPLHPEYHRINTNIVNRVSIKLFQVDGRAPRLLYPDAFNTTGIQKEEAEGRY